MTSPFVFDVSEALSNLHNGDLSQLSPERRHSNPSVQNDRAELKLKSGPCFKTRNSGSPTKPAPPTRNVSQLSQLSPRLTCSPESTEDERCWVEERAAIKEYDAGLPRQEAELQALEEVLSARKQLL